MINENSIKFDLIVGTDVIYQSILTDSGIDVKIHKSENYPKKILGQCYKFR